MLVGLAGVLVVRSIPVFLASNSSPLSWGSYKAKYLG